MRLFTVLCSIACYFLSGNAQATDGIKFDANLSYFIPVANSNRIDDDPLRSLCKRDVQVCWLYDRRAEYSPILFIKGFDSNNKEQSIKISALSPFRYGRTKFFEEIFGIQDLKTEKADDLQGYFSLFESYSEDDKWSFLILVNNKSIFVLLYYFIDNKNGYVYSLKPKDAKWIGTFIKQVHANLNYYYSISRSEGQEQIGKNIQKQIMNLENDFPTLKKSQIQDSEKEIINTLFDFLGIRNHNEYKEVGGNWVENPTVSRTSLKNLREYINKKKECRLAGIANPDCAVVIYRDNGYCCIGCPENLIAQFKKHNSAQEKLTDINIRF